MKKLMFFAVALAAVIVASCAKKGGSNSKGGEDDKLAPVVNDAGIDSLAYNLGLAQSGGLKQYMMFQLGVDSAYIDDFIEGMKEGAETTGKAAAAYNRGLQVGEQVQGIAKGLTMEVYGEDSTQRIGTEQIVAGLIAGLKMADGEAKEKALQEANNLVTERTQKLRDENLSKKYGDWKKQNEEFIAKKKQDSEYKALPSGVLYKVIEPGSGSAMNADSVVSCDYKGVLINDSTFDSSEGKDPIQVNMKHPSVIPGWVDVLKIMPMGAKWEVVIPQEQGYGSREMGPIKPFSTLVFTITTVKTPEPKASGSAPAPITIPAK